MFSTDSVMPDISKHSLLRYYPVAKYFCSAVTRWSKNSSFASFESTRFRSNYVRLLFISNSPSINLTIEFSIYSDSQWKFQSVLPRRAWLMLPKYVPWFWISYDKFEVTAILHLLKLIKCPFDLAEKEVCPICEKSHTKRISSFQEISSKKILYSFLYS